MLFQFFLWLALSILFAAAVGVPLLLLGLSQEYVWPSAYALALLFFCSREGSLVQRALANTLSYGILVSVGLVAGGVALVVLLVLGNLVGFQVPSQAKLPVVLLVALPVTCYFIFSPDRSQGSKEPVPGGKDNV